MIMDDRDFFELKKMVAQSLAYSKEAAAGVRSLKRQARLAAFWGLIKILLVVVPLVWGYLFVTQKFGELKKNLAAQEQAGGDYLKQFQELFKMKQ